MQVSRVIASVLIAGLGASLSLGAYAQGNGSSPKGKPFVEIQGQFVEVTEAIDDMEAHIDEIVADVETLEARVTANEEAVVGLQAQNAVIEADIADLIQASAATNQVVADALAAIDLLEGDLEVLRLDADLNAQAIADAEAEIIVNKNLITSNVQGLQTLTTDLENNYATIDAVNQEIAIIQADLATKQDILAGSCGPGTALVGVDPDGAITCQQTGPGYVKSTVTRTVIVPAARREARPYTCCFWGCRTCYYYVTVPGSATATSTCPAGAFLSGGGFSNPYNLLISQNFASSWSPAHPANSWVVSARNFRFYQTRIYSNANCVSFP